MKKRVRVLWNSTSDPFVVRRFLPGFNILVIELHKRLNQPYARYNLKKKTTLLHGILRAFTMRLSGLQREVLSLYRQCLRESRKKPQITRVHFENFARNEFARNLGLDKRDFGAIEFLLRKGKRQLDAYSAPGIKDIH